jgi:hypothetical protein
MTTIDANGKITGGANVAPAQVPAAPPKQITLIQPVSKKFTHLLAALLASVAAFALTPAGQALIAQYPHLAVVGGLLGTLSALYKDPNAAT